MYAALGNDKFATINVWETPQKGVSHIPIKYKNIYCQVSLLSAIHESMRIELVIHLKFMTSAITIREQILYTNNCSGMFNPVNRQEHIVYNRFLFVSIRTSKFNNRESYSEMLNHYQKKVLSKNISDKKCLYIYVSGDIDLFH